MAKQFDYQLRELKIPQIIEFVKKLNDNHLLVNKGYLEIGHYPDIPQLHFEVKYEREKLGIDGNIGPDVLLNILIWLQASIYKEAQKKGCPFSLPKNESSKEFSVFYFRGTYDRNSSNVLDKNTQKEIISVLHDVVIGKFSGKDDATQTTEKHNHDAYLNFSYNLRQGDLIEQWTKDGGVKAFAAYLADSGRLPIGELLVPSDAYLGKTASKDTAYFSFAHCLAALSEFHRKFKDGLPLQANYNHPSGSKEKKAIDRLEKANIPFFSERNVFEQTLITSDKLTGKLSTDETKLREFIEIFDQAIAALKKDTPQLSSGGTAEDADGGDTETQKEEDLKQAISFDQLNNIVRGQLIGFVLNQYYKPSIDTIEENKRYEIRKRVLGIIADKIDARLNIRFVLRNRLENEWSELVIDDNILNNETLAKNIEELLPYLAEELSIEREINEDINKAVDNLGKSIDRLEKSKADENLPQFNANVTNTRVFNFLQENDALPNGTTIEKWDKFDRTAQINYWKKLTLRQRLEFLAEHGYLKNLDAYSQVLAQEFLSNELANHKLVGVNNDPQFKTLLEDMTSNIKNDLCDIPPTAYGDSNGSFNTEIFIAQLRSEPDFLRIEQRWFIEFTPSLERNLSDYALHHPQDVQVDLSGVNTLEEAAQRHDSKRFSDTSEVDKIVNAASEAVLSRIFVDLGIPSDVRLTGIDRQYSLDAIEVQLRQFLLANPDVLPHFFTETQLLLFINKYGPRFLEQKGSFFLPIVEENIYEAHRQQVLLEIQQKAGGDELYRRQVDEALHYILTQAVLSDVDPEKFINSLNDEELLNLFSVDRKFKEEEQQHKFAQEFKKLIIEYLGASEKALHLDEIIDKNKEIDKEEFKDDLKFLSNQGRFISPQNGGKILFGGITQKGDDPDELAALESESDYLNYEERARQGYQRQRLLALAIWEAYSEEERAILEAQNAQNLAAYEWERILDQKSKNSGKERDKKEKRKPIKKLAKKAVDKTIVWGGTAAIGAVPFVGAPLAAFIKVLPIDDKYKKYLIAPAIAGILFFFNSWGTWIGGVLGSFVGMPFLGAIIGFGVELGIENLLGINIPGVAETIKWISSGWENIKAGISNAWDSVFGGGDGGSGVTTTRVGSSQGFTPRGSDSVAGGGSAGFGQTITAVQSTMTNVATQATVAAVGGGFVGGIILSEFLHASYLINVPDVSVEIEGSSKYASLTKVAQEGNDFDSPTTITYAISITAREGYEITIAAPPNDEFRFNCNEETRGSSCPTNTNSEVFAEYQNFVSRLIEIQGTVIQPGETFEIGTYTVPYDENYDDATIENTFSVNLEVNDAGVLINEDLSTTESICFGECPTLKAGCWPTTGKITQLPYNQYFDDGSRATHSVVDALDIAGPSPNIYSTTAGEACFFNTSSGVYTTNSGGGRSYPYGNHVLVKSGSFALLYAHFATLEEDSGTCIDVTPGTKLGVMGTTGNSTGIHLHWEIRRLGSGFMGYTTAIPGQSYGMSGQTLLEQHSPADGKIELGTSVTTCYE